MPCTTTRVVVSTRMLTNLRRSSTFDLHVVHNIPDAVNLASNFTGPGFQRWVGNTSREIYDALPGLHVNARERHTFLSRQLGLDHGRDIRVVDVLAMQLSPSLTLPQHLAMLTARTCSDLPTRGGHLSEGDSYISPSVSPVRERQAPTISTHSTSTSVVRVTSSPHMSSLLQCVVMLTVARSEGKGRSEVSTLSIVPQPAFFAPAEAKPAGDVGAVLLAPRGVERVFTSRDALHDHAVFPSTRMLTSSSALQAAVACDADRV